MTSQQPTSVPSSIFENGRLGSGIYKIQNLLSETYLDIHKVSLKACCRPARDLEDGGGLVRPYLSFLIYKPNDSKWEIKSFAVGYTVRRVSLPIPFGSLPLLMTSTDRRELGRTRKTGPILYSEGRRAGWASTLRQRIPCDLED